MVAARQRLQALERKNPPLIQALNSPGLDGVGIL
jgi:hypothetical protein